MSLERLLIRPANMDDVEDIYDVFVASVLGLAAPHHPQTVVEAWLQSLSCEGLRRQMKKGALVWVAESAGQTAGFAAVRDDDQVWLVFVHPLAARSGVGKTLMGVVEADARERGLGRLELRATLNSVRFYRHCGYQKEEPIQQVLSGVVMRVMPMHKTL